jgi:leucyl aminopeptidase
MRVTVSADFPTDCECRVYPCAENTDIQLPIEESALVAESVRSVRFTGEAGSWFEVFVREGGLTVRLALVGIGQGKGAVNDIERAGGAITAHLMTSGLKKVAFVAGNMTAQDIEAVVLGARLRAWRIDTYRTKLSDKSRLSLEELVIISNVPSNAHVRVDALVEGVTFTRALVSEPGNILYPQSFVDRCRHLADFGVEMRVLEKGDLVRLGMGALLGVAQGSTREPRILALRWDGSGGTQPEPLAFVGKGVTFDSGGLSLKPAHHMEEMKWDMGGAGAVAGVMKTLALRKARAHVVGVCGLVENMPDGNAQRPGDIVTTMSGQTIEVINTDSEGRLVLADALWWTQKTFNPKIVVDLATLTGTIIDTLADQYGGLFANDDSLAEALTTAGNATGERLWRLPMGGEFDKLIESPIADMKNMSLSAKSITAAQLLKRFIDDGVAWAHLDIAGVVWSKEATLLWEKGATGYGVRLLDRFVADWCEKAVSE